MHKRTARRSASAWMILLVLIGTASAGSGAASTPNATTPGTWVDVTPSNADLTDPLDCSNYGTGSVQVDAAHPGTLYSTERDFIYVTTASLSHEQLQQLSDEVGPERSLLVLCTAFRGRGDYPNLTVKKIPRQVLSRCEWGHDDYSLRVENLPKAPSVLESPLSPTLPHKGGGSKAEAAGQQGLFWDEPA